MPSNNLIDLPDAWYRIPGEGGKIDKDNGWREYNGQAYFWAYVYQGEIRDITGFYVFEKLPDHSHVYHDNSEKFCTEIYNIKNAQELMCKHYNDDDEFDWE